MTDRDPYGQRPRQDQRQNPYERDPYGQHPYAGNPYDQAAQRPPRRRTALIVILSVVSLCLLVCLGGAVYAFTQIGPGIRGSVSGLTSTEVAAQLDQAGSAGPGTYVITDEELTAGITGQLADDSGDIQAVEVIIDPAGIEIIVDLGGQTAGYRAGLAVEGGEIRLTNAEADAGIIGNLIPTDWVAGGLEDGLNAYFRTNDLNVTAVDLFDGRVEITTEQR